MLFQYIKKRLKPFFEHRLKDFTIQEINPKFNELKNNLSEISRNQEYLKNLLTLTVDITNLPKSVGILRDIQLVSFSILKKFDQICRKNQLRYWLDYGTLLGTIRHKGFIPWDDDLDVSMPIKDYKIFKSIANEELKNSPFSFIDVPSQIVKIVHKEFMPKTEEEYSKFIFWQMKEKLFFALDIFPYYPAKSRESAEVLLKNACDLKSAIFNKFSSFNDFNQADIHVKNAAAKFLPSENNANFLCQGAESRVYQPVIRSINDIYPLKEARFESGYFFVPNHPENILTDLYGDYMQFPKDICPHHLFINELNRDELKKIKKAAYESI